MKRYFLLLLSVSILASFMACRPDDGDSDPGLIDPDDLLNARYSDTTTLEAFVIKDDTVRTDDARYNMVGSYVDPVLGKTSTSFYTTVNIAQRIASFGTNPIVDSVVLYLPFNKTYGDYTKLNGYQTIQVFELTQDIPKPAAGSKGYNSYSQIAFNPVPLATVSFAPQFQNYQNEGLQLRVKLNNSIGQRIVDADSLTANNIKDLFKGYMVKPVNPNQSVGEGVIVFFDLLSTNSRISIFFRNQNNPKVEVKLITSGANNVRFNKFEHEYAMGSQDVLQKLTDTTYNYNTQSNLYVQPMQGIRIKVKLPHIMAYLDSGKVSLNRAELIIPVDENEDYSLYPAPANLLTYYSKTGRPQIFMDDVGANYYDAKFDNTKKQYRIIITQYVQNVLNGRIANNGFYIDYPVLGKSTDANRVVLKGPKDLNRPMKINLIYTRVK